MVEKISEKKPLIIEDAYDYVTPSKTSSAKVTISLNESKSFLSFLADIVIRDEIYDKSTNNSVQSIPGIPFRAADWLILLISNDDGKWWISRYSP